MNEINATSINRFLDLFRGRDGVYAQHVQEGDRSTYLPVQTSLDSSLLSRHLKGEVNLGIYVLPADSKVGFCAVDFDIRKAVQSSAMENLESLNTQLKTEVLGNISAFTPLGTQPVIEYNGCSGYRLWLFFHEPVASRMVREYFRTTIQPGLRLSSEFRFEFLPKQNQLREGDLGHLVQLPLGRHPRSGKFSNFLDGSGEISVDAGALLQAIKPIYRNRFFKSCSDRVDRPRHVSHGPRRESSHRASRRDQSPVSPQALENLFGGCDALNTLRRKILSHHVASSQEAHVLTYLLTPLGQSGKDEIHNILSHTMGYSQRHVSEKIRGVAPHYMSCPRVRQRIPEICEHSNCNCEFKTREGVYPTPLLHAGLEPKPSGKQSRKPAPFKKQAPQREVSKSRVREDYNSLKQHQKLIEEKMRELEILMKAETRDV